MYKTIVATKAFLINPQGKILLMRHAPASHRPTSAGKWDVPGGRMQQGEHPYESLSREIFEETGLRLDTTVARPFHVDVWGYAGDIEQHPIVGTFFVIEGSERQIVLSDEHTEHCWYDPRQFIPTDTTPAVARAIEAYRQTEGMVIAADQHIQGREGFGLIQVYSGNGKGKTTAALGQALRAHAIGKKVVFVYFDKGGESHYSEREILRTLQITYLATGRDRIDPRTGRFDFSIQEIDRQEAARGIKESYRFFEEGYDLMVLDEINSTVSLGMLDEVVVLKLIESKPEHTELILTGRNAPASFIQKAHLHTDMCLRKHYYYSGVPAREGLDY